MQGFIKMTRNQTSNLKEIEDAGRGNAGQLIKSLGLFMSKEHIYILTCNSYIDRNVQKEYVGNLNK